MDPFRYNINSLKDRFSIENEDLVRLIDAGVLLPEGWTGFSIAERNSYIEEGFRLAVWNADTVNNFDVIIRILQKNYQVFYTRIGTRLDTIDGKLDDKSDSALHLLRQVLTELSDLKLHVDKREVWVDSRYFCDLTGFKMQSFHNMMQSYRRKDGTTCGHLDNEYNSIEWEKRGNRKWLARLIDIEQIRKQFPYELRLREKKRRGEFKAPLKIKFKDIS